MPLLETALGVTALGSTALLLASLLGSRGLASRALAAFVIGAAVVVGLSELLSFVYLLTPEALLAGQILVLAASAVAWLRAGRPVLLSRPDMPPGGWLEQVRLHRALALLLAVAAVALLFQGFMAVAVAPNEADALGYHLPRAAYWLQHHSALQYQPGQLDDPQLVSPPNAEILLAWTMALSRSDLLSQLVQWLALFAAAAGVFTVGRELGSRRSIALWSTALFVLMPEVLLQSATDQNDLLLTALLLAGGIFWVRGLRERRTGDVWVGAVALGLAVGTKLSFVFAVPALALATGIVLAATRPSASFQRRAAAALGCCLVVFGSFNYVQNLIYTHTVTGFSGTPAGDFVKTEPLAETARVGWDLVDAPGLPQPAWLQRALDHVVNPLFAGVRGSGLPVPEPPVRKESNEDESAYGLVGFLLLVPIVLLTLLGPRSRPSRRLVAGGAAAFFVACAITLGYSPEDARYLMPAIALGAPLLSLTTRSRWTRWLTLILALATVPGTVLRDNNKEVVPYAGDRSILTEDRLTQQTVDPDLTTIVPVIRRLGALVGPHDGIGFLQQDNIRDYLLFGQPLQRRVVGFDPSQVTAAALRAARVRGVLIGYVDQDPCRGPRCLPLPPGLRLTRLGPDSLWVTPEPSSADAPAK
ncbi:MAG: ArnT family glycosyltransferase [Solirubrobacteraceae bacterium]